MKDISGGLVLIAAGCAVIVFRKWFVDQSVDFQNRVYGFRFGEKTKNIGYWFVPVFGLVFIIAGILVLLGIAK